MVWFPLALGAALLWAVGGILVKKGYSGVTPLWFNILNNLLALVLWMPAALAWNGFRMPWPPWRILLVILAAALIYQVFYYSMSKGQISLTGTIIAGYPLFTILLTHLFLGERLAAWQYGGVALILAGGVLVALPRRLAPGAVRDLAWVLWGVLGAAAIGTGDFLSKFSVNRIGPYANLFFLAILNNATSGLIYLLDPAGRQPPRLASRSFAFCLLGIAVHLLGALAFLVAFGFGPASLVSSVSSIYPALLVLLAMLFLGDRITLRQAGGIGTIVAGLLLIGLAAQGGPT
jgi:drug/metabolite transporter (DMT)-like permease